MFIFLSVITVVLIVCVMIWVIWMIFSMDKTNRKNKVLVGECNRILDRMVVKIRKMKETIKEINVLRELLVKDCKYLEKLEKK